LTNTAHTRISFLKTSDILILSSFVGIAFLMYTLQFSSFLSIGLQLVIAIGTLMIFAKRPVFFFIVAELFGITLELLLKTRLERDNINSSGYFLNAYVIIGLFVGYFYLCNLKSRKGLDVNKPMLGFSFLFLLSLLWTKNYELYNPEIFALLLVYTAGHNFIQSDYDLRLVMFSTLISGLFFSIFAIPNILNISTESIYNMVSDTNYTSLYVNSIVAIGFSFLLIYKNILSFIHKVLVIMLNLLLGLVVILTASRTGVIIFVILSISYIALSRLQRASSVIGLTLFSALIISVLFVNFSDYFSFSYDRFFTDDVGTLNSRTDIYDTYINEFIENSNFFEKLFGNGYYATLSVHLAPHNTFIAILSFFGILGLLLFTWYNLQVIFRFGRNKYKPIYLIFFVFLVSGFTLETFNFSICVFMMSLLKSTEKLNGLFSDTRMNKT
jgi:hypothetical protein